MTQKKHQIARDLNRQFSEKGFATQGVEALREGADVSLRTLYKYFPSREAMVVGALTYRDAAYLRWIGDSNAEGADHVLHVLERLADWLREESNQGCLFMHALAAYPESGPIHEAVLAHKTRLRRLIRSRLLKVAPDCDAEPLTEALFVLHEGLTETARLTDIEIASTAALAGARTILASADIT